MKKILNLNFKENEYKEKNINFFNSLNEAIENNYSKLNIVYESNDIFNDNCWYDTLVIEEKQGSCINRIPMPIFAEIIGLDTQNIEYWNGCYGDENLLNLLKQVRQYCNIVKDFAYYQKETEEYLNNNRNSLDKKIDYLLNKEGSIYDKHKPNMKIWYDKEQKCFIQGDLSSHVEWAIGIEYLLNSLDNFNL